MKYINSLLALFALLIGLTEAHAQVPTSGGQYFTVDTRIAVDGRTVGTPRFAIRPDRPVMITVPRPGGYSLRASLRTFLEQGRYKSEVSLELYVPDNDRWLRVATPRISAPIGSPSVFAVPEAPGRRAFRIDIEVREGADGLAGLSEDNGCNSARMAAWSAAMQAPLSSFTRFAALAQNPQLDPPCCQGPCFVCCGESACCSDAANCEGSCCT